MNSQNNTGSNGNGNGNGVGAQNGNTQAVLPFLVRCILLHMLPHLDELVALWICQKFGLKNLPGAEKAPVKFVERVPQMEPDRIEAAGLLCLGLGLGDGRWSLDEHRANQHGSDRLPDECTATLAAKRVGKCADPALKRILDEVLWCDTKSGVRYSQLAELVKLLHRFLKGNSSEVVAWLFPALEAVYMQQVLSIAPQTDEPTLSDFFTEYVEKQGADCRKAVSGTSVELIEKKIAASVANIDRSVTELAHVVRSMHRQGVTDETIRIFCFKVFEAWEFDQIEFDEALKVVEKSPTFPVLVKGKEELELQAIVVRGDSLHLLRAANHCGNRFVVLQNSRGQVQVFVNTKVPGFVTLDTFVGMVRLLETTPAQRKTLDWQTLRKTSGEFVTNRWYYHRDARQLFNGSSTHPAVSPTEIHLDAIVDVLKHAFHPRLIARWMHRIGDPLGLFIRKSEVKTMGPKPATQVTARPVVQVHSNAPIGDNAAQAVEADLGEVFDRAGTDEVATT